MQEKKEERKEKKARLKRFSCFIRITFFIFLFSFLFF